MKRLLTILVLLLTLPSVGKSQLLSIDSLATYQAIAPQDTVPEGTELSFDVKVDLLSIVPYTGPIIIMSGVDSAAGLLSIDTIGLTNVVNLLGSVLVPVYDTANAANDYRTGGDIIVIWPVGLGLLPADTFKADIWVIPMIDSIMGYNGEELFDKISIYPNPASTEVLINNLSKETVERLKIIDIQGNTVISQQNTQKVNVSNLDKGIYLLELYLADDRKIVYKLVKNN